MTADEMTELMYKPLPGEWGERSRDEECERIIAGIDQLITVGLYPYKLFCSLLFAFSFIFTVTVLFLVIHSHHGSP